MKDQDSYLIDGHKLYWHLDRVNADKRGEMIAPIYVEISPTDRCSHDCIFCGLDFKRNGGHSLDGDRLVMSIGEMGELGVRSICFSGEGEPLLHPQTPRFIEACAEAGIDTSLSTNGSVNNPETWNSILGHLSWVRFSVDAGTDEVHLKIHRGGQKGFGQTISTIRQAVSIRNVINSNTTIGVQFILLRQNFEDLETAIELFQDIGVDYLSIKPFSAHPQMERGVGDPITEQETKDAVALIERLRQRSDMRLFYRQTAFSAATRSDISFSACRALPYWMYISSNADVYTCFTFLGDERFIIGNIGTQDMKHIVFGARRRESIRVGRETLNIGHECRLNCRMARINEFLEMLDNPPEHVNFI
jgi:radical SAM protein with 4Fe4S-binding SPASM domain